MKRILLVPIALVLSLLLSSCSLHLGLSKLVGGGGSSTAKATHAAPAPVSNITIVNGKFRPKNATVKVGATLTWTNNSDKPESVTSDSPGVFDSGPLAPGATWKYSFTTAGTFPYHSTGTTGTYGSVIVTP